MRRWPLLFLVLAVLAVGGRYIYGLANRPDDKTQIRQALADAIKASKEGRSGSVIDLLSEHFKVNGEQPGFGQIAKMVKESHPDIVVNDTDPVISGDAAQITSSVRVTGTFFGAGQQTFDFKDAQLYFKKESAMDWLIFPTTKWRLSDVRLPDNELPSLGSE
ncbi:MAG TPA: hypothetical protein VG820_08545 [Fimbriimonadaceae bacterium]|nr:hypothetical protein [Fimbriimonadaceae bacterium]